MSRARVGAHDAGDGFALWDGRSFVADVVDGDRIAQRAVVSGQRRVAGL